MPLDSSIISDVSSGDTIEAEDLRDRFKEIQRFVNGQIEDSDFKRVPDPVPLGTPTREAVIETQHIYKPEFYGSPSPSVVGVSSIGMSRLAVKCSTPFRRLRLMMMSRPGNR